MSVKCPAVGRPEAVIRSGLCVGWSLLPSTALGQLDAGNRIQRLGDLRAPGVSTTSFSTSSSMHTT